MITTLAKQPAVKRQCLFLSMKEIHDFSIRLAKTKKLLLCFRFSFKIRINNTIPSLKNMTGFSCKLWHKEE